MKLLSLAKINTFMQIELCYIISMQDRARVGGKSILVFRSNTPAVDEAEFRVWVKEKHNSKLFANKQICSS